MARAAPSSGMRKDLVATSLSATAAPIGRFLQWWLAELKELRPRRRAGSAWILALRGNEAVLGRAGDGGRIEAIERLGLDEVGERGRRRLGRRTVTLRLPPGAALARTIRLPTAALENLRDAVSFQLDRLTPFPPDEVAFEAAVRQRDAASGQILVETTIVARAAIERALGIAVDLGLAVGALELAPEDAGGTARPFAVPELGVASPGHRRLAAVAAAALAALLITAAAYPFAHEWSRASDLHARVTAARKTADAAARLAREIEGLSQEATFLAARKRRRPLALDLLAELTRRTPDNTWLTSAVFTGSELQVSGVSASAAALIGAFASSPWFGRTEFRSPVTVDPTNRRESFQISIGLKPAAAP